MTAVGAPPSEPAKEFTASDVAEGTSYGDGSINAVGSAQQHTGNRFFAIGEAGRNIDRNNEANLKYARAQQVHDLELEQLGFQKEKYAIQADLAKQGLNLNDKTVSTQAQLTDTHSKVMQSYQAQIDALDQSDPQYLRKLAALTNSLMSMSQAASQVNSNVTTYTSKGHGTLQTAQSGSLGMNSTTTGQTIDANVATASISADTQLGLADRKVVLDTTLANTQAGVSVHHTDKVGATVAQGQANYYTGIGNNTAGFTSGSNYNSNATGNFSGQYGFGYGPPPMAGGSQAHQAGNVPPTPAPVSSENILSGQIQSLVDSSNHAAPAA